MEMLIREFNRIKGIMKHQKEKYRRIKMVIKARQNLISSQRKLVEIL